MPDQSGARLPRTLTLRRLLGLLRPERARLARGTVFLAVGSAMGLLYPKVAGTIIDAAVAGGDRSPIDRAALELVAIAVVQSVAVSLRYVHFSIAGESVVTALREKLYARVLEQDIAFFDERRTGDLTNRLASDTAVLQSALSANISMGLRNAASVLGGLGFLLYTSPVLTALMLLVVPAVAIGGVYYGRYVRRLSKAVQDALAQSNEVAEESISGIRTVRSFAAEEGELARYGKAVRHSFALAKARVRAGAGFMSAASLAAFEPGGWLRTRDGGEVDNDGLVRVLGRIADVILSGGEKIWPAEVETALSSHPGVAAVLASGSPDREWGQRVVVRVVPRRRAEPPTLDSLRDHAAETLARHKLPRELIIVERLDRTALGKIRRS